MGRERVTHQVRVHTPAHGHLPRVMAQSFTHRTCRQSATVRVQQQRARGRALAVDVRAHGRYCTTTDRDPAFLVALPVPDMYERVRYIDILAVERDQFAHAQTGT